MISGRALMQKNFLAMLYSKQIGEAPILKSGLSYDNFCAAHGKNSIGIKSNGN